MKEAELEIEFAQSPTTTTLTPKKECFDQPKDATATTAVDAVRRALEPFGVEATAVCLGWVNDELSSAATRRAARKNKNGETKADREQLLCPGLPPSTLTLLLSFGRAAFESLCEERASVARSSDDEGEDEDPLASHVSAAVDAAARALSELGAAASVAWRRATPSSLSPSAASRSSSPRPPSDGGGGGDNRAVIAVAAALAAGWAPGAAGVVPCISPRLGPWAELAAVLVVGGGCGGGGRGGGAKASGGGGAASGPAATPSSSPLPLSPPMSPHPVLYHGVRAPRASRRAAAPCASALAYSRLVSRGSSGGGLAASAAEAARRQQQRQLSPSPPPPQAAAAAQQAAEPAGLAAALSASPPPAFSGPLALASPVPVVVLSAFAPKTPPLPGSSEDEGEEDDDDDEMSLDETDNKKPEETEDGDDEEEEEAEEEIRRKTEARRALSPGHPFSYPPLMLRYLYSRSGRGARRALAEAVEKVRARGRG